MLEILTNSSTASGDLQSFKPRRGVHVQTVCPGSMPSTMPVPMEGEIDPVLFGFDMVLSVMSNLAKISPLPSRSNTCRDVGEQQEGRPSSTNRPSSAHPSYLSHLAPLTSAIELENETTLSIGSSTFLFNLCTFCNNFQYPTTGRQVRSRASLHIGDTTLSQSPYPPPR